MLKYDHFKEVFDNKFKGNYNIQELEQGSVLEMISGGLALACSDLAEYHHQKVVIDNDIYLAEGEAQDTLYSQRGGIRRKAQSKAKGFWTATNSIPGTPINRNQLKLSGLNGVEYRNLNDVIIEANGTALFEIEALEFGSIGNADVGEITTIVTPIFGLEEGSNLTTIEGGQDLETDNEYRARYLVVSNLSVGFTKDDILRELFNVSGLRDANVQDNIEETPLELPVSTTINATNILTMQRKSVVIFVRGGAEQDIAQALNKKFNLGIKRYGNTTVPVYSTIRDQYENMNFYRATPQKIYFKLEIIGFIDSASVRRIIINYLENVRVGSFISSDIVKDLIFDELSTRQLKMLNIKFSYTDVAQDFTDFIQLKNDEYVGEIEEVAVT